MLGPWLIFQALFLYLSSSCMQFSSSCHDLEVWGVFAVYRVVDRLTEVGTPSQQLWENHYPSGVKLSHGTTVWRVTNTSVSASLSPVVSL